jgi:hypothetical protein
VCVALWCVSCSHSACAFGDVRGHTRRLCGHTLLSNKTASKRLHPLACTCSTSHTCTTRLHMKHTHTHTNSMHIHTRTCARSCTEMKPSPSRSSLSNDVRTASERAATRVLSSMAAMKSS